MSPFREMGNNPKTGRPKRLQKIPDINNQKEGECRVCNGTGEVVEFRDGAYCHCSAGRALEERIKQSKQPNISRPKDPNIDEEGTSQFSSKN